MTETTYTFSSAKSLAKSRAKKQEQELFVAPIVHDGTWLVTDKMPMSGEWWHVYPDGMVIRRG
jgi:hypothetical protein